MAETDMGRLSPASGMDRIEGGQSPAWAGLNASHTVRHDPTLHVPLAIPMPNMPPSRPEPPPQPPPAPLTEVQRREALQATIGVRKAAQEASKAAGEAITRARAHREECASQLEAFAGLESEINAATLTALRGPTGRPDMTPFADKLAARSTAEVALAAADSALVVLIAESQTAALRLDTATNKERAALGAVIEIERNRLREEQHRLERQAAAYAQVAGWNDGHGTWQKVADRLLLDPLGADINVGEIAEEPIKEPQRPMMVGVFNNTVTDARTGEIMDAATAFRRARERVRQAEGPYYLLEQRARERANGIPGAGGSNIGRT